MQQGSQELTEGPFVLGYTSEDITKLGVIIHRRGDAMFLCTWCIRVGYRKRIFVIGTFPLAIFAMRDWIVIVVLYRVATELSCIALGRGRCAGIMFCGEWDCK